MKELFGDGKLSTKIERNRRKFLISAAEFCFAATMKLIPKRHRFKSVVTIARLAVPFFRPTAVFKHQLTTRVDGAMEITLHFILNALTKNAATFDPIIEVKGFEKFEQARAKGRGTLVIGPHAALNLLLVRFFHDKGIEPIVITPDAQMRIAGTTLKTRLIQRSPMFLIKTRNALRRGEVVCAMPDKDRHYGKRTIEFETSNGSVIFAPALLQIAARSGAKVVFTEVHLEGNKLVSTISAPASDEIASAADLLVEDFIKFVRCHIDARFSGKMRDRKLISRKTENMQISETHLANSLSPWLSSGETSSKIEQKNE